MSRSTAVRGLVALVMTAGLVLVGGSAAFAQIPGYPSGGTPTFTIDDSTVVAGQTIGVSGTGCAAGEEVTFTIGDTTVGSATADGSGDYAGTVTIPSLENGEYTINASCGTSVLGLNITVGDGGGSSGGTSGGGLARTGTEIGPLAGLGAAAVVLGAAAVYGTRRRRQAA